MKTKWSLKVSCTAKWWWSMRQEGQSQEELLMSCEFLWPHVEGWLWCITHIVEKISLCLTADLIWNNLKVFLKLTEGNEATLHKTLITSLAADQCEARHTCLGCDCHWGERPFCKSSQPHMASVLQEHQPPHSSQVASDQSLGFPEPERITFLWCFTCTDISSVPETSDIIMQMYVRCSWDVMIQSHGCGEAFYLQ